MSQSKTSKNKSKGRVRFTDVDQTSTTYANVNKANFKKDSNAKNIDGNTDENIDGNSNKNKEKFAASPISSSTYEDIIDTLSLSPTASDPTALTWKDQLNDYIILFLKYTFLVALLTLNFLGLSVSLNCNADQEAFSRIASAVFAFFFGFVYLLINYYTYKVLSQGKICKMNREKLFPFTA
jgi:hypothetical protein